MHLAILILTFRGKGKHLEKEKEEEGENSLFKICFPFLSPVILSVWRFRGFPPQ